MLYSDFLKELDRRLAAFFDSQKTHIRCKPGCSGCCESGDYPMSRLDMEHIMNAFVRLPADKHERIKANIADIKANRPSVYACPFLLDGLCAVYEHRGIVCRTHGLAYIAGDVVKLPQCAHEGLNYSDVFNPSTNELTLQNPIKTSMRTDDILKSALAKQFKIEPEVIRPLIEWFS